MQHLLTVPAQEPNGQVEFVCRYPARTNVARLLLQVLVFNGFDEAMFDAAGHSVRMLAGASVQGSSGRRASPQVAAVPDISGFPLIRISFAISGLDPRCIVEMGRLHYRWQCSLMGTC